MNKYYHILPILLLLISFSVLSFAPTSPAYGAGCPGSEKYNPEKPDCKDKPVEKSCQAPCGEGVCNCRPIIEENHIEIRVHTTKEFIKHRTWMIDEFFTKHILPAMALMTSQLTAVSVQQVQMIGTFFDAKHQLETQRLFQQLMAEAHRDYQPSEGMCEIGTNVRSLAASERKTNLAQVIFSNRLMDRQIRNKDSVSGGSEVSDIMSRLSNFAKTHCNASSNSDGLAALCESAKNIAKSSGGDSAAGSSSSSGGSSSSSGGSSGSSSSGGSGGSGSGGSSGSSGGDSLVSKFRVRDNDPEGGEGHNLKVFDTINYNDGEDYNNITGNYTAPYDGDYIFTGRATLNHDKIAALTIQKNGLDIAGNIGNSVGIQTIEIKDLPLTLVEGDVISLYSEEKLALGNHFFEGEYITSGGSSSSSSGSGSSSSSGGSSSSSGGGPVSKDEADKDISFSQTLESKLTVDVDFPSKDGKDSPDAAAIFALSANLFAHEVLPVVANQILATNDGLPRSAAYRYLDLRSIAAKRSVAQNAFSAMVAERTNGDDEVAPYLKKLVTELGVKEKNIDKLLGENPSYYAQMEVLTKDIYQNPVFYTELYDKPANVLRKSATLHALALMQERDLYKSQLRSEAVLAVILETMLFEESNRVSRELRDINAGEGE